MSRFGATCGLGSSGPLHRLYPSAVSSSTARRYFRVWGGMRRRCPIPAAHPAPFGEVVPTAEIYASLDVVAD